MRDALRCPSCAGRSIWRIRPMYDQALRVGKPEVMAVYRSACGQKEIGSFETYICQACGLTAWFALEISELYTAGHVDVRRFVGVEPCSNCHRQDFVQIETMREVGAGWPDPSPMGLGIGMDRVEAPAPAGRYRTPEPQSVGATFVAIGRLAAHICLPCGHTQWWAYAWPEPPPPEIGEATDLDPCTGCGHRDSLRIHPWMELEGVGGSIERRVAFVSGVLRTRRVGTFELLVCRRCGLVQWLAHGIDSLSEDQSEEIRLLTGKDDPQGDPYRR